MKYRFSQVSRCVFILLMLSINVVCDPTFFYQSLNILLQLTKSANVGFICDIASNKSTFENILKTSKPIQIIHLNFEEMSELLNICPHSDHVLLKEHGIRRKRWLSIFRGIYPGTKWCGMGNRASSYEDLGYYSSTDACCRLHDHCPDYIMPFSSRRGLSNWKPYARYSCRCDRKFMSCLKQSTDDLVWSIGSWYFNVFQGYCFKEGTEKVCLKKGWFWGGCKRRGRVKKLVFVRNLKFQMNNTLFDD